jgi:hypothetical protein
MRSQTVRAVIYRGEVEVPVEAEYEPTGRAAPAEPEMVLDVRTVSDDVMPLSIAEWVVAKDALWAEVRRIQAAESDPDVAEWERVAKLANDARRAGR